MKVKNLLVVAALALGVVACNQAPKSGESKEGDKLAAVAGDGHNAENSLDYHGTYVGVIPAADCPGIEITLTLKPDKSFEQVSKYIDRDSFNYKGEYLISGNELTTISSENDSTYYRVEENRLRILDRERQPITGEFADMYVLKK